MTLSKSPKSARWLVSARFDLAFFIAPGLVSILILLFSPAEWLQADVLPIWSWVLFVLMIDVAHVYASLYRTYFDPQEFRRRSSLYLSVPALAFLLGVVLYTLDASHFWRVLAYLAVFHFIRQQYGFMALYKYRRSEKSRAENLFDKWMLYLSTLYPLAYWHTHLPRKFTWFVEGDFFSIPILQISAWVGCLYLFSIAVYLLKEALLTIRGRPLNIGKNLVLLTTGLTWYVGIVAYNSDFSFTVTNVISHGIPYFALVWVYCHRKWAEAKEESWLHLISRPSWIGAFVALLLVFAFFEEAIWDVLVWGEHTLIFGLRHHSGFIKDSASLSLIIPLLAVPQATHYVLDAFIWKLNSSNPDLKVYLLGNSQST